MRSHSPVLALACEVAPERMPRGAAFIGYCQDESCTLSQWHDISCNAELSCVCQEGGQVAPQMNEWIHDKLKAEGGSYREGLECEECREECDEDWDRGADGSWALGLIGPIIGLTCTACGCRRCARARPPARYARFCARASHTPALSAQAACSAARRRSGSRSATRASPKRREVRRARALTDSGLGGGGGADDADGGGAAGGRRDAARRHGGGAAGGRRDAMAMATATPGGAMPMATAVAVAAPVAPRCQSRLLTRRRDATCASCETTDVLKVRVLTLRVLLLSAERRAHKLPHLERRRANVGERALRRARRGDAL